LKVYTVDDHAGMYMGGCSVVIAEDEDKARVLLDDALFARGLKTSLTYRYQLRELVVTKPAVLMLRDGDY
jgi:glutamate synthase domain-containing protein 3